MKKKIGVYICHCGGNISDYVDVEKVREAIKDEDGVFLSKTTMFACSDSNQKDMVEDIKANELDSVIVSSCSPKLHLLTFRNVCERASLNKYTYVHANIREQASWAHSDDKMGATEKAINLVKAAIAKARYAEALESTKIVAEKTVAVIGAGIAGLKAALTLSDKACPVVLIEKEEFVGGHVAEFDTLFSTTETGKELINRLYKEVMKRENITVLTNAQLETASGSIGNFTLKIKKSPRNINDAGQSDDLSELLEFKVGSVVMATGFDSYTPKIGEFGYTTVDNVITLPEFKRLLDSSNDKLIYKGKEIKNIAYIYCVGSRQEEGENKYCSRNCCTSTIHAAVMAKKKFKGINNYHFNRGLRTYGKQEVLYAESLKLGDIYLQSYEDGLPKVIQEGKKSIVKINDILTKGRELEVEADLVVLVTGMVPRADNSVGNLFKLPKGRDKFYNEIHMKLRPVETVIDGVTIAGTCQGPKNIMESVNSALSAATKSFSYVSKGELETEPIVAQIDANACTWCGICAEACPFDAISMSEIDGKSIAQINNSVCKGCGMCTPVCPPDAIDLIAYSSKEIMSMIDALV
jgi:heterodisulfide reductase subunit A